MRKEKALTQPRERAALRCKEDCNYQMLVVACNSSVDHQAQAVIVDIDELSATGTP